LLPEDVVVVDGVRITNAVRTGFDIGRTCENMADAVVALDVLARGNQDYLEQVRGYAAERPRWGGVPRLRRALRLASTRSRSPGETRFRLLWVVECGLPLPEVNANVLSEEGHLLGMVDLLDPISGLAGEYDGAIHLEVGRRAVDNVRGEGLENAGLVVVRVTSPDMNSHRTRTRHRLQAAHTRALRSNRERSWSWQEGPLPTPTPLW
jgi:hypothetical protein